MNGTRFRVTRYASHLSVALAIGLALGTTGAAGQTVATEPGTRVRLHAPCTGAAHACSITGRVLEVRDDALTVAVGGAARTFALDGLEGIEVSRGFRSRRVVGGVAGFVIGAGATYLILNQGGSTAPCDRDANQDALNRGECLGLYALGGLVGGGLGVLIGGMFRSERFQSVPVDEVRFGWLPGRPASLGLAVKL